jgi:hypothetical protein
VICCSLPVPLSLAPTDTMPLASMSKVTSICGTPRGAGGMFSRLNWPSILLSAPFRARPGRRGSSPRSGCPRRSRRSGDFLVGIVVLRSIRRVKTPPSVSMPSDSGVTSSRTTSLTSPCRTPAWMAAPMATTSSGFTPLWGSLPKNFVTSSITLGMRVMPPTRTTSSISPFDRPASFRAAAQGFIDLRDQVTDEAFQLGAGQLHDHVQRLTVRAHRDERLVDLGLGGRRQLDLRLFGRFLQTLQRHLVLGQVDAEFSFLNSSAR